MAPPGQEKPGLLDASGTLRDLSTVVPDISGSSLSPAGLDKLKSLDPQALKAVSGNPRLGPCVTRRRQIHLHRAQLLGSCRRDRRHRPAGADHLHEGDLGDHRAER
jgi:hypothetical protein